MSSVEQRNAESGRPSAKELFNAALELERAARRPFLERECGGDELLLGKVLSLLELHDADGAFLSAPTAGSPAGPLSTVRGVSGMRPTDAVSTALGSGMERPGAVIGRYKLLQQIGEGGFGAVFMAEQREPVFRRVALKIIKLGMDTRQVIARFEAERQALALMDHPNIARVLDAGATDTGRPYFVMEYVKGVPITQYCDEHNLSIADRLDLFAQVCHAVQHAHQKGVIHRDLKPGNVLVVTQDERPHAKVIDFGIAKATDRQLTDRTLFTAHEAFIGTPQYMSPEQAAGSIDIDTRTDVYSLGVMLYELLTGVTPFDPKWLRSAALDELKRIIREVEPPKPSTRLTQNAITLASIAAQRRSEPTKLGVLLRGDLDWIVMRALEKDRGRRYAAASDLAADIQRHRAGEPVVAAPPSAAYRVRKFISRNKGTVTAATAVAAALILGVIGTGLGFVRAQREKVRADAEALEARNARDHAIVAQENEAALRRQAQESAEVTRRISYFDKIAAASTLLPSAEYARAKTVLEQCPEDLRGWEWNFMNAQVDSCEWKVQAHRASVNAVCISRDARTIATGGADGLISLWRLSDGAKLREMRFQDAPITGLGFLGSDLKLAASTGAGSIVLIDSSTGALSRQWEAHKQPITALAVARDGDLLASGTADGAVAVWKLSAVEPACEFRVGVSPISSLSISRTGTLVAACNRAGEMVVAGALNGQRVAEASEEWSISLAAFIDDESLWVLEKGVTWYQYGVKGQSDVHLDTFPVVVNAMAISSGGAVLCSARRGSTIDIRIPRIKEQISAPIDCDNVHAVAIDESGRWIAAGDESGKLMLVNALAPANDAFTEQWASILAADISPNGDRLVARFKDESELCVQGRIKESYRGISGTCAAGVSCVKFGRNADEVIVATDDGMLARIDLTNPHAVHAWRGHDLAVSCLALSPSRKLIASGSADMSVKVWAIESARCIASFRAASDVTKLAWSPDETRLYVGENSGWALCWEIGSGAVPWQLPLHALGIQTLDTSPDGAALLSAAGDKTVRASRTSDGTAISERHGASGAIYSASGTVITPEFDGPSIRDSFLRPIARLDVSDPNDPNSAAPIPLIARGGNSVLTISGDYARLFSSDRHTQADRNARVSRVLAQLFVATVAGECKNDEELTQRILAESNMDWETRRLALREAAQRSRSARAATETPLQIAVEAGLPCDRYAQALVDCEVTLLEIDPDSDAQSDALFTRALLRYRLGLLREALDDARAANRIRMRAGNLGGSRGGQSVEALALAELGDADAARRVLRRLQILLLAGVECVPESRRVFHEAMATAFGSIDPPARDAGLLADYQRLVSWYADAASSADALDQLCNRFRDMARNLLAAGRVQEALAVLDGLAPIDPLNGLTLTYRIVSLLLLNRESEARAILEANETELVNWSNTWLPLGEAVVQCVRFLKTSASVWTPQLREWNSEWGGLLERPN